MTQDGSTAQAAPSLLDAIRQAYAVELHTPPFPDRLLELARALIACPWAAILERGADGIDVASGQIPEGDGDLVAETAEALLGDGDDGGFGADIAVAGAAMVARVAVPGGGVVALAIGRAQGGQIAQSLAYERLSLLSALSFAQNAHPDHMAQTRMIEMVQSVAADPKPDALRALADLLARHMSADYAAVGLYAEDRITALEISGQDGAAKRASLPDRLRVEMQQTAKQKTRSVERLYAAAPGRDSGLVFQIDGANRNTGAPLLAGAVYALSQGRSVPRRWTRARVTKLAAWALVLFGVGLVPLPDRVEIPATVEAAERRVLTAPFTGRLDAISVTDSQTVSSGTPLLRMETEAIDLDLIEVRAEMARALLDREAARAARLAADLRNAELEVERLDARIARLSKQIDDATLTAPIPGLVIALDLVEKLGTTVRQGDPLIEIADPRAMRLALSIPDDRLGLVKTGLIGRFRPDYDPTLTYDATVLTISPAVSIREERPVLDGRAVLDSSTDGLRPGLRGVFAPQSAWKPAAILAYEAIRDWVLLRVWF